MRWFHQQLIMTGQFPSVIWTMSQIKKREMEVNGSMSTNLGFGGHNAVILFKKYVK